MGGDVENCRLTSVRLEKKPQHNLLENIFHAIIKLFILLMFNGSSNKNPGGTVSCSKDISMKTNPQNLLDPGPTSPALFNTVFLGDLISRKLTMI